VAALAIQALGQVVVTKGRGEERELQSPWSHGAAA